MVASVVVMMVRAVAEAVVVMMVVVVVTVVRAAVVVVVVVVAAAAAAAAAAAVAAPGALLVSCGAPRVLNGVFYSRLPQWTAGACCLARRWNRRSPAPSHPRRCGVWGSPLAASRLTRGAPFWRSLQRGCIWAGLQYSARLGRPTGRS